MNKPKVLNDIEKVKKLITMAKGTRNNIGFTLKHLELIVNDFEKSIITGYDDDNDAFEIIIPNIKISSDEEIKETTRKMKQMEFFLNENLISHEFKMKFVVKKHYHYYFTWRRRR